MTVRAGARERDGDRGQPRPSEEQRERKKENKKDGGRQRGKEGKKERGGERRGRGDGREGRIEEKRKSAPTESDVEKTDSTYQQDDPP